MHLHRGAVHHRDLGVRNDQTSIAQTFEHRVPTPITRRQAALRATVFQNVQNIIQYPPVTPSNVASGLREQVLYLMKLLFRKLRVDLIVE